MYGHNSFVVIKHYHKTLTMKKTHALFPITIVSLFLLSAACKKSNEDLPAPGGPGGPDIVLPSSGHLVCMGIDRNGHMDTLTFWHSTSGGQMTLFGRQYLRAADEARFINNGDGTVNIKRKEPYVHNNINYDKFGIQENPNPSTSDWPDNKYLWTMYQKDASVLNNFIIKRDPNDKFKFTIESRAYPGYFLGVAKWKNATYPTSDHLVFTTKQVMWWFEQR
jgi:hypothetical protein